MPLDPSGLGQQITFAIHRDVAIPVRKWAAIEAHAEDTVRRIANAQGYPELARTIADVNGIRFVDAPIKVGPGWAWQRRTRTLKVPGVIANPELHVLAGDEPPTVVDGYAKFSVIDRPEVLGITKFDGYNPVVMDVPIRFEAARGAGEARGQDIERAIQLLEHMAGRGVWNGTTGAQGPPPVIRVAVTDGNGTVPLIPTDWQWTQAVKTNTLWRIANIEWDKDPREGVRRNRSGNRTRQKATVTLWQNTPVQMQQRSAVQRAKAKPKKKAKK